jgi:hypothetical protein
MTGIHSLASQCYPTNAYGLDAADLKQLTLPLTTSSLMKSVLCSKASLSCYKGTCSDCGVKSVDFDSPIQQAANKTVLVESWQKTWVDNKKGTKSVVMRRVFTPMPLSDAVASLKDRIPSECAQCSQMTTASLRPRLALIHAINFCNILNHFQHRTCCTSIDPPMLGFIDTDTDMSSFLATPAFQSLLSALS